MENTHEPILNRERGKWGNRAEGAGEQKTNLFAYPVQ